MMPARPFLECNHKRVLFAVVFAGAGTKQTTNILVIHFSATSNGKYFEDVVLFSHQSLQDELGVWFSGHRLLCKVFEKH